jgi:hypothetical protein
LCYASLHLEATSDKIRTWLLPNGFGLAAVLAKVSMMMSAIGGWGSLKYKEEIRVKSRYCCELRIDWEEEASVK